MSLSFLPPKKVIISCVKACMGCMHTPTGMSRRQQDVVEVYGMIGHQDNAFDSHLSWNSSHSFWWKGQRTSVKLSSAAKSTYGSLLTQLSLYLRSDRCTVRDVGFSCRRKVKLVGILYKKSGHCNKNGYLRDKCFNFPFVTKTIGHFECQHVHQ